MSERAGSGDGRDRCDARGTCRDTPDKPDACDAHAACGVRIARAARPA
ncbi:hypothetical protein BURPS406E_0477 [Burkholderia pseudomallei 406e]|nr:hypothetical protein BURPS406E_0477 [Burkholderia pseudomallei 406e]EDO90394.1 hypothetical protein BURPSPAST_H0236 [Burkholderia pseudomallei Pasteur 52237]EDS82002.1 hypothetical protein BURPSS13_0187 [Burkholderia pseudomallei S13]KGD37323.1 hypothetical protein DO72_1963 [Burkholderia pseudomallei]KGS63808.1 hypothetical protein X990_4652 [Burkholderia pseudomallei MSHR4868]